LHKVFGLERRPGLTDIILDKLDPDQVMQQGPVENLFVITAGKPSPNPGELLNSQRMDDVIEEFKGVVDVVMFDSPPIIAAVDPCILATKTAGVLMVVQMESTKREDAQYALDQVSRVGGTVLGLVLNDIDVYRRYGYYYSQKYYYQKHYYATEPEEN